MTKSLCKSANVLQKSYVYFNSAENQGQENASINKLDISECIAERNEDMLGKYLEGSAAVDEVIGAARSEVASARLFPVLCGSAMYDVGISELLECIVEFFPDQTGNSDAPAAGIVFKVDYDPVMGKTAHVRLYQGVLQGHCSRGSGDGRS